MRRGSAFPALSAPRPLETKHAWRPQVARLWSPPHFVNIPDPTGIFADIPEADRQLQNRARLFVTAEVLPVINAHWEAASYPLHLARRLGELDLLRDGVAVPGFPEVSSLVAGLATMEINRGDGSVGTIIAVQGGLVARTIAVLGSDDQREQWLPLLARGEALGAFALTEPEHGSDVVGLETRARTIGDEVVIDGRKRWIGNGSVGDVTIVWARGDDNRVGAYLVPQSTPGYRARTIEGKASLRAIWQAEIELDGVRVPHAARLPGARSFADVSRIMLATRLGVAWAALGHATACYEAALAHVGERHQFGRSLGSFQVVQERLARMTSMLASAQLMCVQLSRVADERRLEATQASLAKYTSTRIARRIAAEARDLLGGDGILLERGVIRHMMDLEALHTYEGTETIQALIIGRGLTGESAFS